MEKRFFILFLLTMIISCANQNDNKNKKEKKDIPISQIPITAKVIKLLWGINDKIDSSNVLELAIDYLDRSMYKSALELLNSKYTLDTINVGGFYGFKIASNYEISNYEKYILFRLNDYVGNLSENELSIQLLDAAMKSDNELYVLQSVEDEYLQNRNQRDTAIAKKIIDELKDLTIKFPDSRRVKFLLANEYLTINNIEDALRLFDNLIDDNYYALTSLRTIIQYLSFNKSHFLKEYLQIFKKKFPNECNLTSIKMSLQAISTDSLDILCRPCIKSDFQNDSIFSKLYLAKLYLDKRQFSKVDSISNEFHRNYHFFVFDSTLLFERGLYSDIKMRSLFLQQKFNKICEFIKTDLGYNLVIQIDNKKEFKLYIQRLYSDYISSDMNAFNSFFEKNFNSCP